MHAAGHRVAIVGAGPSGFYAAEGLLRADPPVRVDLFERLPTPYGLVRFGVAPDHANIKAVTARYARVATSAGLRFFGNVAVGVDVTVAELAARYDAVVFATGAHEGVRLELPGRALAGVFSAAELVFWYNAHPDHAALPVDLSGVRRAVVVGNGDVALDVARVLLRSPADLAATDVAPYALDALAACPLDEVLVVGRRGPAQASFALRELDALARLVPVTVDGAAADPATEAWLASADAPRDAARKVAWFAARVRPPTGGRAVRFSFLASPVGYVGDDRVAGVRLERNALVDGRARGTGETWVEEAQLVIEAVGYRGRAIPGVPYRARDGGVPNHGGRVLATDDGPIVPGQYVVGWARRGATGLIGTNNGDAAEVVRAIRADLAASVAPRGTHDDVATLLAARGVHVVPWEGWERIDAHERHRGAARGAPREKLWHTDDLMAAAVADPPAGPR